MGTLNTLNKTQPSSCITGFPTCNHCVDAFIQQGHGRCAENDDKIMTKVTNVKEIVKSPNKNYIKTAVYSKNHYDLNK